MGLFQANGFTMKLEDGRCLFKDVGISLDEGDILVLRGPSGAGKTTLLKCLAELVPYTTGKSSLYGKTPEQYSIPVWRSKIMYVPQRPAVHPGTPMDLFNMVKKYASQKGKQFGDPIEIGMEWNLSKSQFYQNWSYLSGGEMQRAALAIALALEPEILLLDEPTSALDPDTCLLVEKTLRRRTCIWITHSIEQESRVATQSLVLQRNSSFGYQSEDDITIPIH